MGKFTDKIMKELSFSIEGKLYLSQVKRVLFGLDGDSRIINKDP